MKKTFSTLILAVLVVILGTGRMQAIDLTIGDESLNYKVMYKWGLVNKQAGRATLTIRNSGPHANLKLTARSEKWADRFYKVRDTLIGKVTRAGFKPVFYEKIAREGNDHKHDRVDYSYVSAKVIGTCVRHKYDKKGNLTRNEKRELEAYGTTVDMLSSFYYMRSLPYAQWKSGHVTTLNIYSGKRKELLTIKYKGIETVKYDGKSYQCYHIQFSFTGEGKKKTSDDMDAWLSTGATRIPIKLEGKLAVGKVQCFFTGAN